MSITPTTTPPSSSSAECAGRYLDCLFALSRLRDEADLPLDDFFARVVHLLSAAVREQERTGARIVYDGSEYASGHFLPGEPVLSADITVAEDIGGRIEVNGTAECNFGDAEHHLLDVIACEIAAHLQCRRANEDARLRRVTAEKALRESKRQLAQILQGSSVATFVIDRDHRLIHWNQACEKLTGIPADDIIGSRRQWAAFYNDKRPVMADLIIDNRADNEIAAYYRHMCRASRLLAGAFEGEGFFPDLGESGRWLFFTAAPLTDSDGNITGAIETLQDITNRKKAETELLIANRSLQAERAALEQKNIALKEILEQIDVEKHQINRRIQTNIDKIVTPILAILQERMTLNEKSLMKLLDSCLTDITSPFIQKLSTGSDKLTPRESEICAMIRNGFSSKEIAAAFNVSLHTIQKQRKRIRHKLGLTGGGVNLVAYLSSLSN